MSENHGRNKSGRGKSENEKPFMTDERAAEYRRKLLTAGVITEGSRKDEFMTSEEALAYRNRLIAEGMLRPGNGRYRPRARVFRNSKADRS